jgi:hypothetical protein
MDFGKAFTFVFDDPDWLKKIGIAGLIALASMVLSLIIVGVLGFFLLMGWMLELIRRVINHDPTPLPEWDDFGGYFTKGLKAFVVSLVYSLPVILLSFCNQAIAMGLNNSNDQTMATGILLVASCLGCFSLIYGLLMAVVIPAALGQLAVTDSVGAALRVGNIINMVRSAPGAYLLVLLGTIIAQIIASLGIIACGIGVAFTLAYAIAIQGHLTGQAYNVANPSTGGAAVY